MPLNDYVIRPLELSDLDALESLISSSMTGLTSLPKDRRLLKHLIQHSHQSFGKQVNAPENESYFFGLVNKHTQQLDGVSGIFSKIGLKYPFYSFKVLTIKKYSETLKKERKFRLLKLLTVHNGPSEIGGLYLNPEKRGGGFGKFLSLSRFLFMAQWPHRFEKKVIAEMRGVSSASGHSPFWDCVGKNFFDLTFREADLLTVKNRAFIDELVPRYPIYVHLLPKDAQAVIGEPHKHTQPAVNLLLEQGFKKLAQVDIFDGGPKLSGITKHVKTVKQSTQMTVQLLNSKSPDNSKFPVGHKKNAQRLMVANTDFNHYRAVSCEGELVDGRCFVEAHVLADIKVNEGDNVFVCPY